MKFSLPWPKKSGGSVTYDTIDSSSDLAAALATLNNSATGVRVTHKTALQAGVALACARVIAQGLAQVPLTVYREREDGGADQVKSHPLYDVLHNSPNEYQTSFEWREMSGLHLVFAGNAYSQKVRGRSGEIVELLPLLPSDVKTEQHEYDTIYKINRGGAEVRLNKDDILHIKGPSWNGYSGLDGIELARESIGLSLATEKHGSKVFSNGATIPGVLSTDTVLTPSQIKELRESFNAAQQGLQNAWNLLLLHGGLKYQATSSTNGDAQFLETRSFQIEEVCRHFGVLPIMVGHSDKASTYASAEQMFLAHLVHTMGPWYKRLEQSFNKHLLTRDEREAGLYTKFIDKGMLRGSHADRAAYYQMRYNVGSINPNQIRALEDENPYEGGDEYRVPMNTEQPGQKPEEDQSGD